MFDRIRARREGRRLVRDLTVDFFQDNPGATIEEAREHIEAELRAEVPNAGWLDFLLLFLKVFLPLFMEFRKE